MVIPVEIFLSENQVNFLVTFMIPFSIFFMIIFYSFAKLRFFGRNFLFYVIFAGGLTMMIYVLLPDSFAFMASYLFRMGVATSMIVLVGLFIIFSLGIIRWGLSNAEDWKSNEEKLKYLMKQEMKLVQKFDRERNDSKRALVAKEVEDVQKRIYMLQIKMRRLPVQRHA